MPATKRNKNGPVTRSQKANEKVDITTYTTLQNSKIEKPIQVVSKRALKSDPKNYEELEKKFERIESLRKAKEQNDIKSEALPISPEIWENRSRIFFVTHFNVFLYATCFFIQVGTLPVRPSKYMYTVCPTKFVPSKPHLLGPPKWGVCSF